MRSIDYSEYLDRVHGCWLGKCLGGTLGAPYEGMKELMEVQFDRSMIENMLPNDDLDLQVLWLSVLEKKGIHYTSEDLAEAFFNRCPYAPGEYAVFRKNYARGIHPPVSGQFNNQYYIEGMGCPIRAEIWGCIAPGNPILAAGCSAKDGVLDHAGNSVYAEQFLAAVEASAFFESNLDTLVSIGLKQIPADCRIAGLVRRVCAWCKSSTDWKYVRGKILRDYGHPDCTNSFQNIGITLLSLYFGRMDFMKTMMIALNCGFDTDCTCGIAGAILGIIQGGASLSRAYRLDDLRYVLGVRVEPRSDKVIDLAKETCAMGLHFQQINTETQIQNAPAPPAIELPSHAPVEISVEYDGMPAIGIGDNRIIRVLFRNNTLQTITGKASIHVPDDWIAGTLCSRIVADAGGTASWEINMQVPSTIRVLSETNLCDVQLASEEHGTFSHCFGLAGAAVWEAFGPFWQNNIIMPPLQPGEHYSKYIPGKDKSDYADQVRTYHLNTRVDMDREYMTMSELLNHGCLSDAAKEPSLFNAYEDRFSISDIVGFQGPCAVYLVRRLICPEDRVLGLHIGHTDAYRLWINGELISKRDNTDWWTAENVHVLNFMLHEGVNTIVLELMRQGADADFSLVFAKGGPCTAHYTDMASINPLCPDIPASLNSTGWQK